jgi:hypothetical protein
MAVSPSAVTACAWPGCRQAALAQQHSVAVVQSSRNTPMRQCALRLQSARNCCRSSRFRGSGACRSGSGDHPPRPRRATAGLALPAPTPRHPPPARHWIGHQERNVVAGQCITLGTGDGEGVLQQPARTVAPRCPALAPVQDRALVSLEGNYPVVERRSVTRASRSAASGSPCGTNSMPT